MSEKEFIFCDGCGKHLKGYGPESENYDYKYRLEEMNRDHSDRHFCNRFCLQRFIENDMISTKPKEEDLIKYIDEL